MSAAWLLERWCELPPRTGSLRVGANLFDEVNSDWQAHHPAARPLLRLLADDAEQLCDVLVARPAPSASAAGRSDTFGELRRIFIDEFDEQVERGFALPFARRALEARTAEEVLQVLLEFTRAGCGSPIYVQTRPAQADRAAVVVPRVQTPPLPPGDYQAAERRHAYVRHMAAMAAAVGVDLTIDQIESALSFEQRFWFGPHDTPSTGAAESAFPWNRFLRAIVGGRDHDWQFAVPPIVKRQLDAWWSGDVADQAVWLCLRVVFECVPFLSESTFKDNARFFSGRVLGVTDPRPRHKRFVSLAKTIQPDDVEALYVKQVADARVISRSHDVAESIREHAVGWSQARALGPEVTQRLLALTFELGANVDPRHEKDPGAHLSVCQSFFDSRAASLRHQAELIDHPERVSPWVVPAHTATAYYAPESNSVVVPWAILRPPLVSASSPHLQTFALFGALVAHEAAHAILPSDDRSWEDFVVAAGLEKLVAKYEEQPAMARDVSLAVRHQRVRELVADALGLAWSTAAARAHTSDRIDPTFLAFWATRWRGTTRQQGESGYFDKHPDPVTRCNLPPLFVEATLTGPEHENRRRCSVA